MQVLTGLDKLIPNHPKRKRVYDKFNNLLDKNINKNEMGAPHYSEDNIKKMALNIERGIFNHSLIIYCRKTLSECWNEIFSQIYINRAVLVYDNLNPNGNIKNTTLLSRFLSKEFKLENLCMAGGVALNCVANGKILKEGLFKNIWIQPASGDAGGALGAAQAFYYQELDNKRKILKTDSMNGSYLGPKFSDDQVEAELKNCGANFKKLTLDQVMKDTAKALSEEKAVGWFQGRMEFGPRSLGNRSIIADSRSEKMQKNLNLKVKYRESFRPFAPAILFEKVSEWFEINSQSPYMLLVADVKKSKQLQMTEEQKNLFGIDKLNIKRSSIPSVTHVDYSARIQTVHKETNPIFHKLIEEFERITKFPVLVNTSFNVRGEPIVCSVTDAFNCFMGTDLDILVCNNFILHKDNQNKDFIKDYKNKYELD